MYALEERWWKSNLERWKVEEGTCVARAVIVAAIVAVARDAGGGGCDDDDVSRRRSKRMV